MGQAASKATEAAKRAAPRISQTIQSQRTRTAAEAEWKRSPAASGGGEYSPTRGHQHQADTDAAIAAAASSEGGGSAAATTPEMPPDLIKFLNDAGPLQRSVDKEMTSAKVYDSLLADEKAEDEQAKQANVRVRRKMPIMSEYKDSANDYDGTMTERSTNFSTKDRTVGPTRLGVTRADLFRLSDEVKGLKVDSPEWKKRIETEYKEMAKIAGKSKNFDQLQDLALFENSLRYIGVPVSMIDTEGDIIGTWHHKAEEMKHSSGLKVVPERSIQFVMQSEKNVAKES
ncbi:hypothetical protein ACHAXR_008210 [Thalassiosira sp. AJA248-18]